MVIPKLYNGKNRTFFLFSYEWIKTVQAQLSSSANLTVPTAANREGDFSALLRLGANYQIYDPFTRTAAPNGRFTNLRFRVTSSRRTGSARLRGRFSATIHCLRPRERSTKAITWIVRTGPVRSGIARISISSTTT